MRVCALVNREQVKRLSKNTTIHDDRPSRHARSMLFAFCILLWQTITKNMLMSSWILKPFSLLYIDFHTLHIQQYAGIFRVSLLFVVDRLSLSSVKLCRLNSIYSLEMQIKFWVKLRYIYTTRANISIFSTVCVCVCVLSTNAMAFHCCVISQFSTFKSERTLLTLCYVCLCFHFL